MKTETNDFKTQTDDSAAKQKRTDSSGGRSGNQEGTDCLKERPGDLERADSSEGRLGVREGSDSLEGHPGVQSRNVLIA